MPKKQPLAASMEALLREELEDLEGQVLQLKHERGEWAGRAFEAEEAYRKLIGGDEGGGEGKPE